MTSRWAWWRLRSPASRLFTQLDIQAQIKENTKLRVTGRCAVNSPVTGEFPAQRASNAENVSIWWRHRVGECYALFVIFSLCYSHIPKYILQKHIRSDHHLVHGQPLSKTSLLQIWGKGKWYNDFCFLWYMYIVKNNSDKKKLSWLSKDMVFNQHIPISLNCRIRYILISLMIMNDKIL